MRRDPRFDDLSGEYNDTIFQKTYGFLADVKQREKNGTYTIKNLLCKPRKTHNGQLKTANIQIHTTTDLSLQ